MKCILILICGFLASDILALKCVTPDGLQVDEVRKVIKTCMKKVTASDSDAKLEGYDEYENFESEERQQQQQKESNDTPPPRHQSNDRMNNYNNNYNPSRVGHDDYDYQQTGGNYHREEMNRRQNDRHDPSQYNPYQLTYGDNDNFNNQRGNFHRGSSSRGRGSDGRNKNNNNNDNSTADIDKHERDRSCILQCFFSELKMTNEEGFPDRNRMISVMTKQLRDKELRDFYVDSIQECSRMLSQDEPRVQRDNCLFSKNLIICLSERAKMNCIDWNAETVIF